MNTCVKKDGNAGQLLRFIPGAFLLAVGLVYLVAGMFILCVLKKADPGFKDEADELKDAAKDMVGKANKAGKKAAADAKEAAGNAQAQAQEGFNNARASVSQAAQKPPANENPFAI